MATGSGNGGSSGEVKPSARASVVGVTPFPESICETCGGSGEVQKEPCPGCAKGNG
jgi:DnaJ-class molecular chaperone